MDSWPNTPAVRRADAPEVRPPPCSLIVGRTTKASIRQFRSVYGAHRRLPKYTLLLDRGLILARRPPPDGRLWVHTQGEVYEVGTDLDLYDRCGDTGPWAIYRPPSSQRQRGHALMWLYYACVARLNREDPKGPGSILNFTNQIVREFPMSYIGDLADAKAWPA